MRSRLPQLDGIRGLAILLVIFHNQGSSYPSLHLQTLFANGWMGVDLFFVLSGFLITGILLDSKESDGYFRNFYARRCLRIWPLYYALIFFMFVIVPAVRPSEGHIIFEKSSPWWSYPFYLQNFLVSVPTNAAGGLGVTWSLAVEEQFYLIWPVIIRYCSRTTVRRLALAVACLSPVLRLFFSFHGVNLYSNPFCRLDGLMAGSLLALFVRSGNAAPARFVGQAWAGLVVAIPLAFLMEAVNARWLVYSLSAAASVSFVYLSLYSGQKWLRAALTNRFMVYTGTISYGLYLLHKIPFDLAKAFQIDRHPLVDFSILLIVCYGVASLSWSLYEKPFLKLKRLFETEPIRMDTAGSQPLAAGLKPQGIA